MKFIFTLFFIFSISLFLSGCSEQKFEGKTAEEWATEAKTCQNKELKAQTNETKRENCIKEIDARVANAFSGANKESAKNMTTDQAKVILDYIDDQKKLCLERFP